ncbi:MAG: hypothetical protein ACO331_10010, partial [Prochlorothrix sp.]
MQCDAAVRVKGPRDWPLYALDWLPWTQGPPPGRSAGAMVQQSQCNNPNAAIGMQQSKLSNPNAAIQTQPS